MPALPLLFRRMSAAAGLAVEPARDGPALPGDGARRAGTNGGAGGTEGRGIAPAMHLGLAGLVLLACLVNAATLAQDAARRGEAGGLAGPLLCELTSALVVLALLPALAWLVGLARRQRGRPARRLALLAGSALAFSAAHILGMVALRLPAFAALGGAYRFDWSAAGLLYEFRKDLLAFAVLAGAYWLALRPAAASAPLPAAPPPGALWLRDGGRAIRLRPEEILWVGSAGNYVEYRLRDGRSHLLRATLAAEEARLAPHGLLRIHRTRLVNPAAVMGVARQPSGELLLRLDGGEAVTASRRHRAALLARLSPAAGMAGHFTR